jgi:hypothetical protein
MNPGSLENSPPWATTKIYIPRDRGKIVFAGAKYILKYFANTSSGKLDHPHPNQQVGTEKQFQHRVSLRQSPLHFDDNERQALQAMRVWLSLQIA